MSLSLEKTIFKVFEYSFSETHIFHYATLRFIRKFQKAGFRNVQFPHEGFCPWPMAKTFSPLTELGFKFVEM